MSRHRTPAPPAVPAPTSARGPSAPGRRRRSRSTRLTVAAALLAGGAALVLAVLPTGSYPLLSGAAAVAVALGAIATRATHAELLQARRDAAADRAERAHATRLRLEQLDADHRAHAAALDEQLRSRERAAVALRARLADAEEGLARTRLRLGLEVRRVELAGIETETARSNAARSAEQVALLEAELDASRAALDTAASELDALRGEVSTRRTQTGMPLWVAPNA